MENKVGKKINLTIIFLGLLAILISFYCARMINEENIIILLSFVCIITWTCIAVNFSNGYKLKKNLNGRGNDNSYVLENNLKNENDVVKLFYNEDSYRTNMLKKATESTVMLVDKENNILGTAIFINNEGNLLACGYKLDKKKNLIPLECGEIIHCKFYNSDKLIEAIVEKVFKDKEGNLFSLLSIELNNYTKSLTFAKANNLNIGNKVYAICSFEENKNINVIEGIIAQINQEYKINNNNKNIFKSNNCILYNGISTKASIGGPLLNINGEIIGILLGKCEDYERLSFAVPIENLKDVISEYKSVDTLDEITLDKNL